MRSRSTLRSVIGSTIEISRDGRTVVAVAHGVAGRAALERVGTSPTKHGVPTDTPFEKVVATTPDEHIGASKTANHVGPCRAHQPVGT